MIVACEKTSSEWHLTVGVESQMKCRFAKFDTDRSDVHAMILLCMMLLVAYTANLQPSLIGLEACAGRLIPAQFARRLPLETWTTDRFLDLQFVGAAANLILNVESMLLD